METINCTRVILLHSQVNTIAQVSLFLQVILRVNVAATFPKLRLCSNSQHSAWKLAQRYPAISIDQIKKFYGYASSRLEMDLWSKLVITKLTKKLAIKWPGTDSVNMTEFFQNTSPGYFIYHCQFGHIDCRRMWRKVVTFYGVCLEFNPVSIIDSYSSRMENILVKDKAFEFEYDRLI